MPDADRLAELRAVAERAEGTCRVSWSPDDALWLLARVAALEGERTKDIEITSEWCRALQELCNLTPEVHLGEGITGCVEPLKRMAAKLAAAEAACAEALRLFDLGDEFGTFCNREPCDKARAIEVQLRAVLAGARETKT